MPPSQFNRDYELAVQVSPSRAVIVRPPIRIAFDVSKSVAGGLNSANIDIYGLKRDNRLALAKDQDNQDKVTPVSLAIGYKGSLRKVFQGTVHVGSSRRDGAIHVTTLECLDGGYDWLNSFTAQTVKGSVDPISAILADMPNTQRGKITEGAARSRPRVLVGASAKLLNQLTPQDATWYIDNEQLYVLRENEVVRSYVPVVNAKSGLLDTPSREQSRIMFATKFNPSLIIGGLCQVESVNAPHLNGIYKIDSIGYTGDTHGSEWSMSCSGILMSGYVVVS